MLAPTPSCLDCSLHTLCFPPAFGPAALDQLSRLIETQRILRKGEAIYQQGDRAHAIYAVRSGALKTVTTQIDGQIQVAGFYLPGEVIGLENLGQAICASTAIAMEKTG